MSCSAAKSASILELREHAGERCETQRHGMFCGICKKKVCFFSSVQLIGFVEIANPCVSVFKIHLDTVAPPLTQHTCGNTANDSDYVGSRRPFKVLPGGRPSLAGSNPSLLPTFSRVCLATNLQPFPCLLLCFLERRCYSATDRTGTRTAAIPVI